MRGKASAPAFTAQIAVALAILLSVIALAGWTFGIAAFTSIGIGWARMSVPTILCAMLCAAAILQQIRPTASGWADVAVRRAAPGVVVLTCVYVLLRYNLSEGFHGEVFGARWGQVAPATALTFLLLAAALLLPGGGRAGQFYAGLSTVGLVITALALVGYAYGVDALAHVLPFSAMSLPTSLSLALLLVAALLARPDAGWTAILLSREDGGRAARRLLPFKLVLPFLFGWAAVTAYRHGIFEAPFGFAILAVLTALTSSAATLAVARWLSRSERERLRGAELIRAITDNTPALVYAKDLDGRYLLVNRRYCDVFHADADAVIGKTDFDFFSEEAASAYRAVDRRVTETGHTLVEEETAPHDDVLHDYLSVKSPLRDAAGNIYGMFGISTDITDRKQAEAALARSEHRARLVVDTALDAVVSIDRTGRITGWNPQAETIFGWSPTDALGRQVDEVMIPEPQREAHRLGLARYLATGTSNILGKRLQLTALRRDGGEFPVELSITPIRADDTIAFTGFVRDITDRKLAETRLQTQLERLALLDQITRAIGQRLDMNSIFQVTARAVQDRLPADFVCICRHDPVTGGLTAAHIGASSDEVSGIVLHAPVEMGAEELARCLSGTLVHEPDVAAVGRPFTDRLAQAGLRALVIAPLPVEGAVSGLLMVARAGDNGFLSTDCEFLKQLGEHVGLAAHQAQMRDSLQRAYDDLRQSQQAVLQQERLSAIGQMASGIAHDINNAISPIAVYTQSLRERAADLPSQVRDYLDIVGRVTKDVSATVARMRDFYRPRDSDSELVPVDLNELVPQVIELTRARWSDMPQERGIVIDVKSDLAPALRHVMGDASEIREAMTNLLFNAVDAMPEGGTITLRTRPADEAGDSAPRVRLEVGDTGAGMDEETRKRCLDPFFTTKGERGTGLGLAMVYGAAQRHKARLDIDSAPGRGTSISLEFAAAPATATATAPVEAKGVARPLRLLLVDDDPAVLQSTAFVLNLEGHRITTSDGGAAGVEALRAAREAGDPFDAVITDLGMPYVDGNEVARTTKELFPDTAVVLLTGWGRRMSRGDEAPAHVDFVLPKPPDLDDLRGVLAQIG